MTLTKQPKLLAPNQFAIFFVRSARWAYLDRLDNRVSTGSTTASGTRTAAQNTYTLITRDAGVKDGFAQRPAKGPS